MTVGYRRFLPLLLVAVLALPLAARAARRQDSETAALAQQLASLLVNRKLDAVAARDASAPDQFVAALHFPDQLLVVWARHAAPARLAEKLSGQEYRAIYIDLNSASIAESKVLVTDAGIDGLHAGRDVGRAFDTVDAAGARISFDGNWDEDGLSEADYMKAFQQADAGYAAALRALIAELQ